MSLKRPGAADHGETTGQTEMEWEEALLLPHCLDDYVTENNPVRVIEAFIDELDLATVGFDGVVPETTGLSR